MDNQIFIFTYSFTFVFASEDGITLTSDHFGDSNRFYIYKISENGNKVEFIKEIDNKFKNVDDGIPHGSKKKRQSIISFLGKDINFIVAGIQSPNFDRINNTTPVAPIVCKIKNIDLIINYLKLNFNKLVEIQKSKLSEKSNKIMVIEDEADSSF